MAFTNLPIDTYRPTSLPPPRFLKHHAGDVHVEARPGLRVLHVEARGEEERADVTADHLGAAGRGRAHLGSKQSRAVLAISMYQVGIGADTDEVLSSCSEKFKTMARIWQQLLEARDP